MTIIDKVKKYGIKKSIAYSIAELKRLLISQMVLKYYSQDGEDLIIDKLLNYKKEGFYVDVGANDPIRYNNTKRFYDKNWSGINIEPDYLNYEKLLKYRPRDINLNIGIGENVGIINFYKFNPDVFSTFSVEQAKKYQEQGQVLENKIPINVHRLCDILEKYCEDKDIDFFSIDVEGLDMEVLKSNNWEKFRPTLICIESVDSDKNGKICKNSEYKSFLNSKGYRECYSNSLNSIYKKLV
jgi:FkbM family methyltransferase